MYSYADTEKHQQRRHALIEKLRNKDITDEDVLTALQAVPRHFFVSPQLEEVAYEDRPLDIGANQTISQPYTVAYQTQLLDIQPGDKVLEIGTGSMYQAAVLAEMGAKVYSIERQKTLFDRTRSFPLKDKYPHVHFFYGDGFEGIPTHAPYDKILITAAASELPHKLCGQLKTGGKLVLPINRAGGGQQMVRFTKQADESLYREDFELFSFVPMLSGVAE